MNGDGGDDADCDTEDNLTLLNQVAYFDTLFGFDDFVASVKHVELARFLPPALAVGLDSIEIDSLLLFTVSHIVVRMSK